MLADRLNAGSHITTWSFTIRGTMLAADHIVSRTRRNARLWVEYWPKAAGLRQVCDRFNRQIVYEVYADHDVITQSSWLDSYILDYRKSRCI